MRHGLRLMEPRAVPAVIAVVVCVATLVFAWRESSRRSPAASAERTETPDHTQREKQRSEATKLRLELAGKLFDLSIILLGALWGLLVAGKLPIDLTRWTDAVLFAASNLLLSFSIVYHIRYRRDVARLLWDSAPYQPDIHSDLVNYLFRLQWVFFFASLIPLTLTVLWLTVAGGA